MMKSSRPVSGYPWVVAFASQRRMLHVRVGLVVAMAATAVILLLVVGNRGVIQQSIGLRPQTVAPYVAGQDAHGAKDRPSTPGVVTPLQADATSDQASSTAESSGTGGVSAPGISRFADTGQIGTSGAPSRSSPVCGKPCPPRPQ